MMQQISRDLVEFILSNSHSFKWSIQGFGMLRLYLPGDARLNVWDSRYRVNNVSLMHNHPWNFDSVVVSGCLRNIRYRLKSGSTMYHTGRIQPGPGGGLLEQLPDTPLIALSAEKYEAGSVYRQEADEIHVSDPEDGTITINYRERVQPDQALVFWPTGEEWVSAEPRPAVSDEVESITSLALRKLQASKK